MPVLPTVPTWQDEFDNFSEKMTSTGPVEPRGRIWAARARVGFYKGCAKCLSAEVCAWNYVA